jgi:hypothetical protein
MRSLLCSATAAALAVTACTALADPPETVKDRAGFLPQRKQQPLKGTAVGVLVSNPQPVLNLEGRSGPADSYCFSADGNSYRWVYVPTLEMPQITNLQVPVGDKGEKRTYPALNMANPRGVVLWGIKAPYAMVRVQVNSGEGSPAGDSFVATEMKQLDGTPEFPLKVVDVIQDLKKRYAGHVQEHDKAINEAMDAAQKKAIQDRQATGPREKQEVMYVTWLTGPKRLRVHFRTRLTDGEYKYAEGGIRPRPVPLPVKDQRIQPPPPPPRFPKVRYGTTFGVEFGMAYEVSKKGDVVGTAVLPPEGFQQNLPVPPRILPPRGGPVRLPPAPPVKKD